MGSRRSGKRWLNLHSGVLHRPALEPINNSTRAKMPIYPESWTKMPLYPESCLHPILRRLSQRKLSIICIQETGAT
eukprot:8485522-Pyramimonas_sp.AAC.1